MVQSYKIFIKDVPLLLSMAGDNTQLAEYEVLRTFSGQDIHTIIKQLYRQNAAKGFVFESSDPENVLSEIRNTLPIIRAAGGIVWNKSHALLMIFRRGKWDLPKGKVELGESIETAALREVEEESGIGKLRLIEKFDTTYHIYPEREKWFLKETHWFEMTSRDNGVTVPQISEGITKVSWVAREEIIQKAKNTYASMKDLISRALQKGYTAEL